MSDSVKKSINQFSQQMERIFGLHLSGMIVYGSYAKK